MSADARECRSTCGTDVAASEKPNADQGKTLDCEVSGKAKGRTAAAETRILAK
jgi:hypothetical protein